MKLPKFTQVAVLAAGLFTAFLSGCSRDHIEAINLSNETQRVHGRNENQALFVTQTGPRFMIGARYKFGQ